MFTKKPRFTYCSTTDEVLYRRFIYRYGYKDEYFKFCVSKGFNPKRKRSMYLFMVSKDIFKFYTEDIHLGLRDKTLFDIVKVKWL